MVRNGLPEGFEPVVVNTRRVSDGSSGLARSVVELVRTTRILFSMAYKTISVGPAVVHVNCSLSPTGIFRDLLCGTIAKIGRKPLVTQYHGDIPDWVARCESKKLSISALRWLLRLSNVNIALNSGSLAHIERAQPGHNPIFLPNFIEDEILQRNSSSTRDTNSPVRGLYVGHLLPAKGMDHIRKVSAMLPEVEFRLLSGGVGDIGEQRKLMPDNVEIVGAIKREEVLEEMLRSDFFFFPSHSEGFPNAVLEAMAMGLPVISTRVGAVPEMVVEGQGGFLADKDDSEGLGEAIRSIMDDIELRKRMGDFNRARSRALYSYSAVAAQLVTIYEGLIGALRTDN